MWRSTSVPADYSPTSGGWARDDGSCDSGSYEFGATTPATDDDFDGVLNNIDMCSGTVIPEAAPISGTLGKNRWALTGDADFDQAGPQAGSKQSFSLADTGGCSCAQIVEAASIGGAHLRKGCSTSVMLAWVELVNTP